MAVRQDFTGQQQIASHCPSRYFMHQRLVNLNTDFQRKRKLGKNQQHMGVAVFLCGGGGVLHSLDLLRRSAVVMQMTNVGECINSDTYTSAH